MTSARIQEPRRIALVGTGVIGGGWATRFLARGYEVVANDPGPGAEERLREAVANAGPAARRL
jgi:carnitine 3-dehydrogenase